MSVVGGWDSQNDNQWDWISKLMVRRMAKERWWGLMSGLGFQA